MVSSAPGSIKLFGEHAVIYGRLGLSAAFDRRAEASVEKVGEEVEIVLKDFNIMRSFSFREVEKIVSEIGLGAGREIGVFTPHLAVIGNALRRFGKVGLRVEVSSKIPRSSGMGSSAGVFAALATELNKSLGLGLLQAELVELANAGDMVVHRNPSGIDAHTCVLGGYLSYRRGEGAKPLGIKRSLPIIVVDSGDTKDTGEVVAKVRGMHEKNPNEIGGIFDFVERCAVKAIGALEKWELAELGGLMNGVEEKFFRALGLETKELAEIMEIAKNGGALGAKVCGAGRGGCAVVLSEKSELVDEFSDAGFSAFMTRLGVEGAK